jgi:hypothetical protein
LLSDNTSALHLVLTGDPTLFAIVWLSLSVSVSAVLVAAVIGMPLGALVALTRFRGREFVVVLLNALMGLPPVVVGQLWQDSRIDIEHAKGSWYKSIGQGMGAALNTASASDAYTLSDRATWIHFKNKGHLKIMVEGDKHLFNQYGVMLVSPDKHPNVKKELGQAFIEYLISPAGQQDIASYRIDGQQLFYPNARDPNA